MKKMLHVIHYGCKRVFALKAVFPLSPIIIYLDNSRKSSGILKSIIIFLLCVALPGALYAATKTWTGATNNDWNTGSNWGGTAPAAGDIANIPGGLTNYPIINNTVTILTVNINTAGSGASITVTTGGTFNVTGLLTVNANGSFIQNDGTSAISGLTSNNIVTFSGGTLLSDVNITLNSGASMAQSGGLIHLAINTSTIPTDNILIATGATFTQSGGTLYIKDYAAGGGTFNQTNSTALFKVYHDWKPGAGSVFNSTAGTVQFTGSGGGGPDFLNGTRQFSNIIIDAGVDPVFGNDVGSTIPVSGNFTNNNTTLITTANATFTFNGTGTQTITSAATGTNSTFGTLVINNPTSVVLASNIYIAGDLTIQQGTFDQSTYLASRTATGGTISMSSGTYLTAGAGLSASFTTNTFATGSTVEFNGSVSETIPAYNYANLTSSGSGARVLASSGTIGIAGTFTPGTNSYTITGSTINFNGTGSQTIPAFTYNNLTVSGARTTNNITYAGSGIIAVAGTFNPAATFTTGGRIITGSTIEFNGTGAQTVPAFTYNNLTTSGARTSNSITYSGTGTIAIQGVFNPSATFTSGGRIITGSTIEFNGSGTQTIPAFTYNNLTSSNSGARILASSGTVGVAGNFTPGSNSYTVTGSTVDFNGSGSQTIGGITFNNLTTSNAGTKSSAGNIAVNGTFTVTSPTIFSPGATDVISGSGTLTGTGTILVTRITGTPDLNNQYTISNKTISTLGVDYSGAGAQTINALNYGNLTISTNGTRTVTLESTGTIGVTGSFTPTATTTTYVSTGSTVNFNGSGAQTIPSFTFNNITTSNGGTKTTGGNIVANGTFTVTAPTQFNPGATHVISGSGTLTGTGEIKVTKITVTADLATQYTITNKTLTNLAIDYSGAGAQTINNTFGNYSTLKISGSGIKSLQGAITVTGDIIINAGTLDVTASNYAITIGGNFTNNATVTNYTERTGTVTFNGSGPQQIDGTSGTRTFYNIVVAKTAGQTLSAGGSVTILNANGFTLTTGNFSAPATVTFNGNVLLSSGMYTGGINTNVVGNWTNNGATFTGGTNVNFAGITQLISGSSSTAFPTINVNNASAVSMDNNNSCTGFNIGLANSDDNTSFTHIGTSVLTVNGSVLIHQGNGRTVAWNINAGSATVSSNVTLGDNLNKISARLVITSGTLSVAGDLIFNSTGATAAVVDLSGGAATLNIAGNLTLNTLATLTPGTSSTVVYNGTGAQIIGAGSAISYYNLTINKSAGTATPAAAFTVNGTLTLAQGTLSAGAYNIICNGSWINNGGTFIGGTADVLLNGTGTLGGSTSTDFANLSLSAASTGYTMTNNNSCTSFTFDISAVSTTFTHSGTAALTVNGIVTINQPTATATNSWNINAGTATVSGLITLAGTNNSATRVGQIVITTGTLNANGGLSFAANTAPASKVINMSGGAGVLNLKGALTFGNLAGTLTAGTSGSIFNYADNSAAQTVNYFPGGAYHNLHINTTGSTGATLSAAITTTNVTGNLRVQSGTLSNGAFAIALNTSKTFEVANGATFKMTGTTGMVTGTTITKTFGATSTCDYNGAAQTVSAETYGHLILSTSGIKTMPASAITIAGNFTTSGTISATAANALTIGGNVTLGSGTTFSAASFTHNIGGNWTNNGATFTPATSTLNFNGTGTQTLGGTVSTLIYNNLIINKSSGIVTLSIDLTVNATLTFTLGNITTSSYKVIIPSTGSISGSAQSTGWVNGNLQKYFSSTAGGSFQIGGSLYYSPLTISFATVTTAGSLIAGVTAANHPNISGSTISDRNISRYWTLSTPGSGALVYTNATISFTWNTADNYSPITASLLFVARYSASTWSYPTVTGTTTTTTIQITGITTLGDFAIGQAPCINITWSGSVNNQWENGSNWSCGEAPTSSMNVTIPSSLSTYPVISGGITALVNNITIQSGGTLTVTSSTLKIAGTISNSGTFTASAGTIEMNGSSAQTIPASTFASNTIKDLTINNTAGVTLGGALNITNDVTISGGSLTTGGYLTLKSSSTATARIARITSIAATPVNGNVIAERYIQGRRKYRLMTSPVTTHANATLIAGQEAYSIWGNWQNQGNNSTANTGTIITGGSGANGFDQQTTTASLYTYNESGRSYTGFTTANGKNTKYTPLKAGVAYYMFVYGDRLNAVNTSSPSHTVLSASGTILSGDQTYTTSSTIPLTNTVGNYTMLGNPYASPIDWATVTKTNLYNTFWGWDPNLSSTGGYVTVSTTGTVTLISPFTGSTGLNQYIQSGQGFFVRTSATSPVLTIKESDKVSNYNTNAFRTAVNDIPLIAVNLFDNNTKTFMDGAVAAFSNTFSNQVGKEDATKMNGSAEVVSIVNGSELLSIEARQMPGMDDTLSLKMSKLTKPQYLLQIFTNQMDNSNVQPYLYDSYLNTVTVLSLTDTNRIVFNVNSDASSFDANRFKIVYSKKNGDPVIVTNPNAELRIFPNPVINQVINYQFSDLEKGNYNVTISDAKGHQLLSREIKHHGGALTQTLSFENILAPGLYYFRIETKKLRYSKTIFIQ